MDEKTVWADILHAHIFSAAHYQTTRYQLPQTYLMEHSANTHVTEFVNHGLLALQVGGPHKL